MIETMKQLEKSKGKYSVSAVTQKEETDYVQHAPIKNEKGNSRVL